MNDIRGFGQYCHSMTDSQLQGVYEKEFIAAASGDEFRVACCEIVKTVADSRGLLLDDPEIEDDEEV